MNDQAYTENYSGNYSGSELPPQSFTDMWLDAWRQCGWQPQNPSDHAETQTVLQNVYRAYAEPQRHYHTQQHLHECLEKITVFESLAKHYGEIVIALWFHDAIYDIKTTPTSSTNNDQSNDKSNELRSADWARQTALDFGLEADQAARIHQLIMNTLHNAQPDSHDAAILVDVDLSILGMPVERFTEYEQQVRAEYAWVPEPLYRQKRSEVLQHFLKQANIYHTDLYQQRFETQARDNLTRSLKQLSA